MIYMNENGIQNCIEPLSMKMLSVLFISMRRYRVIDIEARPKIEELRVIEKELRVCSVICITPFLSNIDIL